MNLYHSIMFRADNTEGYTQAQLDAFNAELAERIRHIADDDLAGQIAKSFHDEVANR